MAAKKKTEEINYVSKNEVEQVLAEKSIKSTERAVEANKSKKRIGLKINTPYCSVPDINSNIGGILNAGNTYVVYNEIDNGENGSFYDIGGNRYINKDWDVIIFE